MVVAPLGHTLSFIKDINILLTSSPLQLRDKAERGRVFQGQFTQITHTHRKTSSRFIPLVLAVPNHADSSGFISFGFENSICSFLTIQKMVKSQPGPDYTQSNLDLDPRWLTIISYHVEHNKSLHGKKMLGVFFWREEGQRVIYNFGVHFRMLATCELA